MFEEESMQGCDWHHFCEYTDSLTDSQLVQLEQALVETKSKRSLATYPTLYGPSYHGNHFSEEPPYAYTCSSPTLQPSIRSSRQSNSAHSADTASLGSTLLALPYPEQHILDQYKPEDHDAWNATQAGNNDHALHHPLSQDLLPGETNENSTTRQTTPLATNDMDTQPISAHFCTYCYELNNRSSFKTKHDWKRHESVFHETGYEWRCQVRGCSEVFAREKDFKTHSGKLHRDEANIREVKEALPERRVYACGFRGCRELEYNWKSRCDHVSRHMTKGHTHWDYSWKMLNLLRHSRIHPTWKQVKSRWLSQLRLDTSALRWDCKASRNMRRRLECQDFDFDSDLTPFLELLLRLGLPKSVSPGFYPHAFQMGSLVGQRAPVTPNPAFHDATNAYDQTLHTTSMLSYADQRHPGLAGFENLAAGIGPDNAKRNSVTMLDAPDLTVARGYGAQYNQDSSASDQELLTLSEILLYSTNTTPPVAEPSLEGSTGSPRDTSKISPRCKLMRKSKELFPRKRSPHLQQRIVTDHPDLTLNYSVPVSPHGRQTTALPASLGADSTDNYR